MNYILKITTRYNNLENGTIKKWAFKTYNEAIKRMIEELEALNRQLMATELTDVTGYTIELREWTGLVGSCYDIARIDYDI